MRKNLLTLALGAAFLAGCGNSTNDGQSEGNALPASPAPAHAHADWAGNWIGQEGLFVEITPTEPGQYNLEMMGDTDRPEDTVTRLGRDAEGGIAFERDGSQLLLRRATGDEIGLKYLDGLTDCLMVQEGEGFCRDQ